MSLGTRTLTMSVVVVVVLLGACAPPSAPAAGSRADIARPARAKKITAVIRGAPASLVQQRTQRAGGIRGLDGIEELTTAGLKYVKFDGTRAAQLAEQEPTVENGLWRVLPDGRMETTWKVRPTAQWHDGVPFTTDDLLFTATVERDREVEIPPYAEYDLIEAITAPDAHTITVTWKRPYIDADGLFSYRNAGLPIPKHTLERSFGDDRSTFTSLPY